LCLPKVIATCTVVQLYELSSSDTAQVVQ